MSTGQTIEPLTARQRQVLELLVRGRTNYEIAQALGISLDGAKWHVREVLARLGVDSREEAAEVWRRERSPARRALGAVPLVALLARNTAAKFVVAAGAVAVIGGVAALAIVSREGDHRPASPDPTPTSVDVVVDDFEPRSDIAIVDEAVAALVANDSAAVIALLRPTDERCMFPGYATPGARTLPCPPAQVARPEDGLLVQTTRGLDDGEPRRLAELEALLARDVATVRQFHGVSTAQHDEWDGFFAPWKYEVLASAAEAWLVLLMDDTGVLGVVTFSGQDPSNRTVGGVPREDWLIAPYSVPRLAPEKSHYVIGRDIEVRFVADLPPACAGKPLAIRLYEDPDPGIPGGIQSMREPGLAKEARAIGASTGETIVSFKLPAVIAGPMRVRAGLVSSCLSQIAVQNELNLALPAPPADADVAIFEILGKSMDQTAARGGPNGPLQTDGEYFGGELTASVDGYACGTQSVVDPLARNARGNVVFRVGTSDQPAACRAPGREVVFVTTAKADGTEALSGSFELVPGVIQLVRGLGPQAPHTPPRPPLIRE